jgi:hypothetical protein
VNKNDISYCFEAFKNLDEFKSSKFDGDSFQRSCDLLAFNGSSFGYLFVFPFFEKLTTNLLSKAKIENFLEINYVDEDDDDIFDFQEEINEDSPEVKGNYLKMKNSDENLLSHSPKNENSHLSISPKNENPLLSVSPPTIISEVDPMLNQSAKIFKSKRVSNLEKNQEKKDSNLEKKELGSNFLLSSSPRDIPSSPLEDFQKLGIATKNRFRTGTVAIKENREIEASRTIDLEQYFFALSILFKGTMEERLISKKQIVSL